MRIIFEQIRIGGDRNFGYLLGDRDVVTCASQDLHAYRISYSDVMCEYFFNSFTNW